MTKLSNENASICYIHKGGIIIELLVRFQLLRNVRNVSISDCSIKASHLLPDDVFSYFEILLLLLEYSILDLVNISVRAVALIHLTPEYRSVPIYFRPHSCVDRAFAALSPRRTCRLGGSKSSAAGFGEECADSALFTVRSTLRLWLDDFFLCAHSQGDPSFSFFLALRCDRWLFVTSGSVTDLSE